MTGSNSKASAVVMSSSQQKEMKTSSSSCPANESTASSLKMKIKRKNVGSRSSEVKHEVVLEDKSPHQNGNGSHSKRKRDDVPKDDVSDVVPEEEISARKESSTCTSMGTMTEAECLGPCEPGTSVTLDGVVWQETEGGVLVVNVTWREKSYVGTLLDCTKHDWAPPRLCDSPVEETDMKGKGRGKRRAVIEVKRKAGRRTANSGFTIPASPKRKTEPPSPKRSRTRNESSESNSLIECPEPNCNKKYKHINGLKYHQTHAHEGKALLVKLEEKKEKIQEIQEEEEEETVKEEDEKGAPSPAYSDISDDEQESSSSFRPPETTEAFGYSYPLKNGHEKEEEEGMKPTMETTGPPSSSSYFLHHPFFPFIPPPPGQSKDMLFKKMEESTSPKNNQDQEESKEPPPQRHLHTHHHTHVGVGYPVTGVPLPPLFDPYGGT